MPMFKPPKGFASLKDAGPDDISFCSESDPVKAFQMVLASKAGFIYVWPETYSYAISKDMSTTTVYEEGGVNKRLYASNAPKLDFIRRVNTIYPAANTRCGDNWEKQHEHVIIVGVSHIAHTVFEDRAVVYAGCTIGYPALSYERDKDQDLMLDFPHLGMVHIHDDVVIGPGTNISRGTLSDTVIEESVRIDAHCHIAHNVRVGHHSALAAGTVIGGSAEIGDHCWLGLNCTIKDHVKIGNNVVVGCSAAVVNDVPDMDIIAGVPARSIKEKCRLAPQKRMQMAGY